MSSKKLPVSINIFPTLDAIELVQYDEISGEIEKATSLPCSFDLLSRQMSDREQFRDTIRDLYNMNRIPMTTPAVLVLPSFFTREIDLPTEFSREELRFALVSEAERFYIFKKTEPMIDWINLEESRLLYSAFPKAEIEKYLQSFQENRIPLLSIELSYFSILRGLVATGAVASELESNDRWGLLVISDNSFYASIQTGSKILKTTDAPLSNTNEDEHAAVQEIQQDFETFIEMESFNKLVLVQNAKTINTENLLSHLPSFSNLILIEQNTATLRSRGASDGQFPCSLEAIGGVFYTQLDDLPRMNFLPSTSEDVVGIMHYRKEAFKWLLIANGIVFILCLLLWGVLALIVWQKDTEREQLAAEASKLASIGSASKYNDINRKKFIKSIVDQNIQINNFLVKLGGAVQQEVWLNKIEILAEKINEPVQISVEGNALNLDKVNQMKTELNQQLQNGDMEVSNAGQATSPNGQAYFSWTLQNKAATTGSNSGSAPGGGGHSP